MTEERYDHPGERSEVKEGLKVSGHSDVVWRASEQFWEFEFLEGRVTQAWTEAPEFLREGLCKRFELVLEVAALGFTGDDDLVEEVALALRAGKYVEPAGGVDRWDWLQEIGRDAYRRRARQDLELLASATEELAA